MEFYIWDHRIGVSKYALICMGDGISKKNPQKFFPIFLREVPKKIGRTLQSPSHEETMGGFDGCPGGGCKSCERARC